MSGAIENTHQEYSNHTIPSRSWYNSTTTTIDEEPEEPVVDGLKAGLFAAAQHWRPEVTTSSRGRYPVNVSTR